VASGQWSVVRGQDSGARAQGPVVDENHP